MNLFWFLPQVTASTDFAELQEKEPWLSSCKLVVKPDMLFGKRGKSGLVALNLDLAQVATFVKERLGKEVLCPSSLKTLLSFFLWFSEYFDSYIQIVFLVMSFSNI